jgi:DNA (cytosine-5)-methyltransferase 1
VKPATVVELFAGCGGMSCGLASVGYKVTLGVDINAAAIDAFDYNHEHLSTKGLVADVRELDGKELRDTAGLGRRRLVLLVGGPPCQPFSIIGKRMALHDDRGDLVLQFIRLVRELEPEAFVFENVANFARIQNGEIATMVVSRLARAGYAVTSGVLDASAYGVAQMRKRFLAIGVRGKQPLGFPAPTHGTMSLLGQKPIVTCREVLDDLPDVDTPEALCYRNHEGTTHSPAMIRMFEQLRPGERDPKSHHDRLDADRPAYTIRAGNGNFSPLRPIHYRFNRVISVRESARIQSFPDHFAWPDDMSRLQQYRHVGNAVPPLLAAALGHHIAERLGLELDPEQYGRPSGRTDRARVSTVEEQIARRQQFIRGASTGRR